MLAPRRGLTIVAFVAVVIAAGGASAARGAEELVAELESLAGQAGDDWVRIGKVEAGGLSQSQLAKLPLTLRKGACYRFLAVSDGIGDLDLRVFSGGKQLAADQGTVASPRIDFCSDQDRQGEARLQVNAGSGQYAFGVYARAEGATPLLSQQESAALAGLAQFANEAAAGMEPLGEPHAAQVGHRQAETVEVLLDRARCYKFLVAADPGITAITLGVSAGGAEVAADRISGGRPAAQWCAPERTRVQVKLLVTGGSGALALGVYGTKAAQVASPEKVGGFETDFIANRLRQIHAQYGKGRAAVTGVMRGNLGTSAEQVFDVRLHAGHCYTVIGVGSPSVKDIDVSILDRAGREIHKDTTSAGFTALDTAPCPTFTGNYTLKIRVSRGLGQFGAQVFSD
jgi:hypothetical protein